MFFLPSNIWWGGSGFNCPIHNSMSHKGIGEPWFHSQHLIYAEKASWKGTVETCYFKWVPLSMMKWWSTGETFFFRTEYDRLEDLCNIKVLVNQNMLHSNNPENAAVARNLHCFLNHHSTYLRWFALRLQHLRCFSLRHISSICWLT